MASESSGGHAAWAIIPARGGSVGVPRKNVRILAGKPLIQHVIDTTLEVLPSERVIVVTDDEEIASVARAAGASVVLERMATPPDETLDTKIARNLPVLRERGALGGDPVLTIQPTSPLLRADTIRAAIRAFHDDHVRSVLTVARDQHLRWRDDGAGRIVPSFAERVNRQELPLEYRETGGVIATRLDDIEARGTRVIEPVRVIELGDDEAIDIDGFADLLAAAHLLSRLRVAIRVDASRDLGMGHVYRMLALAAELARHDLTIYVSADADLGRRFFARSPYRVEAVASEAEFVAAIAAREPDLVVLDLLDTAAATIDRIRTAAPAAKVVTFEDRGSGAERADLLVAEFIDNPNVPPERTLAGIDHALLAPGFEHVAGPADRAAGAPARVTVEDVLILFGGTDPSGLADRALRSLARVGFAGRVTVARGLGASEIRPVDSAPYTLEVLQNVTNMPALMARSDLAYTSAGRTVIELLSSGTPAVCLAQNAKELTHTHATAENGVLALGLGSEVSDAALDAATRKMLTDGEFRRESAARAARAGAQRSNRRTVSAILARLGFDELSVY